MDIPLKPMPIILNYEGIFDLDTLYDKCAAWFIEQGYEFHENTYKKAEGKEEEILWDPWKNITDYIKFIIKVKFFIIDMEKIDVVKEGKKVKLTKARMRLELDMKIEKDYSGRFKGHPFLKKIKEFYERFIFKKEYENVWEDMLYYHVFKLQTLMKEHLDSDTKTNAYYNVW